MMGEAGLFVDRGDPKRPGFRTGRGTGLRRDRKAAMEPDETAFIGKRRKVLLQPLYHASPVGSDHARSSNFLFQTKKSGRLRKKVTKFQ